MEGRARTPLRAATSLVYLDLRRAAECAPYLPSEPLNREP